MELSQQPKRQDTAMSMNTEQGMDTEVGSETEWRKQAENRAMDYGGQSQAMEENLAQGMKNQETRTQAMEGSVTGQSPGIDNARMQGTQDDMNYEDTGTSERLHGSKMHDHSKDPTPGTSTRSSRSRTEQSSGGSSLRHLMVSPFAVHRNL